MYHPKAPTQLCRGSGGTLLSWSSDSPALGLSCPKLPPLSLPSPSARGAASRCAHSGAAAGVNHCSLLQTLPSSVWLLPGTLLQLGLSLATAIPQPLPASSWAAPDHHPAPAPSLPGGEAGMKRSLPLCERHRSYAVSLLQREQQHPVKFPARAGHQQGFGESRFLISCSCRSPCGTAKAVRNHPAQPANPCAVQLGKGVFLSGFQKKKKKKSISRVVTTAGARPISVLQCCCSLLLWGQ